MKITDLKNYLIEQNKKNQSKKWLGLILHHSLSQDGKVRDWPGIEKYHMSWRIDGCIVTKAEFDRRLKTGQGKEFLIPYRKVGYNFGIEQVEDDVCLEIGRSLLWDGAHAKGFNHDCLGLCIVGNFDKAAPPKEIWNYTLNAVRIVKEFYGFRLGRILGHRETYPLLGQKVRKTCPGRFWDMEKFRKELYA